MNYKIEELEDQIIESLKADTNFANVNIATHVGGITGAFFQDAQLLEGLITQLPFVFIQYQGKRRTDQNSDGTQTQHQPTFRLFVGAESLRSAKESQRSAYAILRAIYDRLHAKFFSYAGMYAQNKLDGVTEIVGPMYQQAPLMEIDGQVESLIVNLPRIVVYSVDYNFKVTA